MPRSKAQNEQVRTERRQAILAAATPLFARNGFAETAMSEVAKASGVSHGTVFLYFPSKEELFREVIIAPLAEAEAHFKSVLSHPGTPLQRIERLVREQVAVFSRKVDYLQLIQYVMGRRHRFPQLFTELFSHTNTYARLLVPLIQEGQACGELAPGDPIGIATAYLAFLNGTALSIMDPPGAPIWDEMVKNGMRIFAPLDKREEG